MPTLQFIVAAFALVAFGGFLAATDAALGVLSRADLLDEAARARAQRSLRAIAEDLGAHVNVVNFVRIVAETTAAVLVTIALSFTLEEVWQALILSVLIMAAVSFVLVGSSPRSVGRTHARTVVRTGAVLVHVLRVVLGPVAAGLVAIGDKVTPGRQRLASFSSEEQLLSMVDEAAEQDVLEDDDRELIHSIFEFNETVVREIMVPRTDMVTIDSTASVGAGMGLFLSRGISRLPVIAKDADDVAGILYLRDVARYTYERPDEAATATVTELVRPAVFVPESKKADSTLRQMQLESNHLAMVVDEYGGIAGLVTLEDLIEELVGDISDEYDRESLLFEEIEPGHFRVSARLPVDELGELFDLELDDDDVDSVGGLLTKALGRLPETGAEASIGGVVLTAERADVRRGRISSVLVRRDPDAADEAARSASVPSITGEITVTTSTTTNTEKAQDPA